MKTLNYALRHTDDYRYDKQSDIAAKTGYSLAMIKKLWNKESMNTKTLETLCQRLPPLSPSDFF